VRLIQTKKKYVIVRAEKLFTVSSKKKKIYIKYTIKKIHFLFTLECVWINNREISGPKKVLLNFFLFKILCYLTYHYNCFFFMRQRILKHLL